MDLLILTHWQSERVQALLDALCYSKLGRMTRGEAGSPQVFSFVHRRFHEYFSARYLRQNPHIAPIEDLLADNRWREVLVLLCEVLPSHQLSAILDVSGSALSSYVQATPGTDEHRKAIEALRFLRDAFRSRLEDLPNGIRMLCSEFIRRQFVMGNLLDQKRAVESTVLADEQSAPALLADALDSPSDWIQETALRSCRVVTSPPEEVKRAIRKRLYQRYRNLDLYQDYSLYSVLFSTPSSFAPLLHYTRMLVSVNFLQVLVSALVIPISFMTNTVSPLAVWGMWLLVHWLEEVSSYVGVEDELQAVIRIIVYSAVLQVCLLFPFIAGSRYWMNSVPIVLFFLDPLMRYLVNDYPVSRADWLKLPYKLIAKALDTARGSGVGREFLYPLFAVLFPFVVTLVGAFFALKECGVSFRCLYDTYNIVLATLFAFSLLLWLLILVGGGVFTIIASLRLFLRFLPRFISGTWSMLRDQATLRVLSMRSSARPASVDEAIEQLHKFKSITVQGQYVRALRSWLPIGTDWDILIEEANEHRGAVRDGLYQLVELWQDSQGSAGDREV